MMAGAERAHRRVAQWPQWKKDVSPMTTEQQFETQRGSQPILSQRIESELERRADSAKTVPLSAAPTPGPGPHGWAPIAQRSRRPGLSLAAQVATLIALVAMGWQAHSFVASLEAEHAEIRDSIDSLYAGLADVRTAITTAHTVEGE